MILLKNIKLEKDDKNLLRDKISKTLRTQNFEFKIYKKSIDARKGVVFNYQVLIKTDISKKIINRIKDASLYTEEEYDIEKPHVKSRVVIIGSGPAGLFCAYILAKYGSKPIIIEQGEPMEDRIKTIGDFLSGKELNTKSNVQFGEGGAGTYSDGKLTARSKDKRQSEVLKILVEHGAPEEILYDSKPHIGTDILRNVMINMRNKIIELGGEFQFNSEFEDLIIKEDQVESFVVSNEKIIADNYVMALGNSSRKSFELLSKKIPMVNKAFAVGFRIEHKREFINQAQYRTDRKDLPSASYTLKYTDKEKNLSGYTFCMCPGGYVINASSEKEKVVVNGMSYHDRDAENSNAALIVTVNEEIYGKDLLDGLKFQREIEKKAFKIGGEDYKVPVQRVKDFIENRKTGEIGEIKPSVRPGYRLANLRGIYPEIIDEMIIECIKNMDKKLRGFAMDDAILTGVETRSSSPVRMLRDGNLKVEGINNLYAIGEGSGYSGGIVSSAIDGIKAAEKMLKGC